MLKIVILGYLPTGMDSVKGGVEAVIKNLLNGFTSKEIEIHVFSLEKMRKEQEIIKYSKNITIHHFPFGRIKSIKFEMLRHGRKVLKIFLSEIKPDLIHVQGNGSNLLLLKGLNYSQVVITPHASLKDEIQNIKNIKWKINHFINIWIERKYLAKIKYIIFISKFIQDEILKYYPGLKENYSALIYNPVNVEYFNCRQESLKTNTDLVYLGAINHRKGLSLLFDALSVINQRRNNKIKLHIIGGFTEREYEKIINKKIIELNLSAEIKFYGWLKQEEIIRIFNNSSIFVLPSKHENLPVSLIEAMSSSIAIVASNVGGVSEIIEDGYNGFLFGKNDLTSLISILNKTIGDRELRIRLSRNGRDFAVHNFHPVEIAQKTINYYQNIINNKSKNKIG